MYVSSLVTRRIAPVLAEEVDRAPRGWVARTYDLRRFEDLAHGGHFAALEAPDALAHDLREFFRPLRAAA